MQRPSSSSRHAAHQRTHDEVDTSTKFDFSRAIANFAPIDVFAILGFAFLGCWTFWFAIQCLLIVMYPAMAIAFGASLVFFVCSFLLIRARLKGPYQGSDYDDVLYEAHCYARMLGTRDPDIEEDDETKECTIYCRKRCLTLNFADSWLDDILWSSVRLKNTYGSKTLTLNLPKHNGRLDVKFLFDSAEDKSNVEACCKRLIVRKSHAREEA